MITSGVVDAVSICTPSGVRLEPTRFAAENGVHVLVEKPMEISVEGARAAFHACKRAGVTLAVVFQSRTKPRPRRVHRVIRDGALGRIVFAVVAVKWHRPEAC